MNNLAYSTQVPEKVAAKIEEVLRKDLEAGQLLSYDIEKEEVSKTTVGSVLKDISTAVFGGKEERLLSVSFNINEPRSINIIVGVNKQGIGCHVGSILFYGNINKAVKAEIMLEEPKAFGTSKFKGDSTDDIAKLNSNKDLLKLADKFAKTKTTVSGGLKLDRFFKIIPSEEASIVVVNTLARSTSMGFGATTDAKDFFTILTLIEQTL